MYFDNKIWFGVSEGEKVCLLPRMANRHGMICGATGTGKTITLKVLAESFSAAGIPVFLADIKGDLSGMCSCGALNENVQKRIEKLSLNEAGFDFASFPTVFWDVYGENGIPLRTTISEMGPLLLSRIMGLNDTQTDLMTVLFKIADDENLLLIDTKDLKALLNYVAENAAGYSAEYGNIPKVSINTIIRSLVALESEGADQFFGETALDIRDWLYPDKNGEGVIQILDCQTLIQHPTMYATFLLWMMSELFETLPEAGDLDKPKMVFFFDEAHMLFNGASKVLLERIEQVVKLIRSKGVGIYFITQSPKDIPDGVQSQLGNKIEHALHAYTPTEQKAVKSAAQAFRPNPAFDTYSTIMELGIGEALVSVLDEDGVPSIVQKTKILPPQSLMGALGDTFRKDQITSCSLYNKYMQTFDRDSAYEFLQRQSMIASAEAEKQAALAAAEAEIAKAEKEAEKERVKAEKAKEKAEAKAASNRAEIQSVSNRTSSRSSSSKDSNPLADVVAKSAKSTARNAVGRAGRNIGKELGNSVGGKVGKQIGGDFGSALGRNLFGTLFKK